MDTVFMILAFVGTFSCGFFACLTIVFCVVMIDRGRQLKRQEGKDGKDKRAQY